MKKLFAILAIGLLIVGCSPKAEDPHLNEEGEVVVLTSQEESAQILNKHIGDIIEQQDASRSGLDLIVLLESNGVVTEGIKFDSIGLSETDVVSGKDKIKYAVGMFEIKLVSGDVYKVPVASSFDNGNLAFGKIDGNINDFVKSLQQ